MALILFKATSPLRRLSTFLNKQGPVWSTVRILTGQLNKEGINHVVIGGLAVYIHGYERTTSDCDILLAKQDYDKFMEKFVGRGLTPRFPGSKKAFIDSHSRTNVDVIVEGEYPGDGTIGPVFFPNPNTCKERIDDIDVISLPKLIDLKLTSYRQLPVRRAKDLADVVELMKCRKLDQSFVGLLDPSVRNLFNQLVITLADEEKREGPGS